MMNKYWILVLILLMPTASIAGESWLIAMQNELLNMNGKIKLEVVKPNNIATWPDTLTLTLSSHNAHEQVELVSVKSQSNDIRCSYIGLIKSTFDGTLRAELTDQDSNRLL
ncbi:MAG: hypothetical protein V3U89_06230, partial [Methylophilaceae bacterium]